MSKILNADEIRARIAELEAANEEAAGWGAAVGARHEEIMGLRRYYGRARFAPGDTRRPPGYQCRASADLCAVVSVDIVGRHCESRSVEMSGPLPFSVLSDQISALKETLSGDALKAAVTSLVDESFDAATAKVHGYLAAGQLFRDDPQELAYFNTLSLGNWLMIAGEAEIDAVPARILAAVPTQALFSDAMGNERPEHFKAALEALDDAIQAIDDDEMLRFDPCGSAALKSSISEGRGEGRGELVGPSRGYIRSHNGRVDHILCERLADAFLWHPEDYMPVFARPIIKAKKRGGWAFHTGAAGQWPCEWRVYVKDGAVIGVSNYYPQAAAGVEDVPTALLAAEKTERLISTMADLKIVPHHSRYEGALDTSKASFSADFIEREDGELLFLEAGPAHIFRPAFGASPCCFNPNDGISGIALAPGVIVPLERPSV